MPTIEFIAEIAALTRKVAELEAEIEKAYLDGCRDAVGIPSVTDGMDDEELDELFRQWWSRRVTASALPPTQPSEPHQLGK